MTAIANGRVAAPEVLASTRLLRESIGLIRAAYPTVLYAWLAIFAVSALIQFGAVRVGLSTTPQVSGGYIGYMLAVIAFSGAAHALTLRLLSEGRVGWLRFDRPLLECAGLLMLGQFILSANTLLAIGLTPAGNPKGVTLVQASIGLGNLVLLYVMAKLVLWPLARLDGRLEVSAAQAWGRMRRTVRSLVGAWLLAAIPLMGPTFVGYFAFHVNPAHPHPAYVVLATGLGVVQGLVNQGVVIAIYRQRLGGGRSVAEVFD